MSAMHLIPSVTGQTGPLNSYINHLAAHVGHIAVHRDVPLRSAGSANKDNREKPEIRVTDGNPSHFLHCIGIAKIGAERSAAKSLV
jgi:hypothetical protein